MNHSSQDRLTTKSQENVVRTVHYRFHLPESVIKARLCDEDLWKEFHSAGTEMVLTKVGRRIFPGFRVQFSGLDKAARYTIMMDIVRVDNYRYKFQNGGWISAGEGEAPYPEEYFTHPMSQATGDRIMQTIVSFHKVKLTNSPLMKRHGTFLLHSMHRYLLRAHIARTDTPDDVYTCHFPLTDFITVTAYQNTDLSRLKIANNPYARGFRDDGARSNIKYNYDDEEIGDRATKSFAGTTKQVAEPTHDWTNPPINSSANFYGNPNFRAETGAKRSFKRHFQDEYGQSYCYENQACFSYDYGPHHTSFDPNITGSHSAGTVSEPMTGNYRTFGTSESKFFCQTPSGLLGAGSFQTRAYSSRQVAKYQSHPSLPFDSATESDKLDTGPAGNESTLHISAHAHQTEVPMKSHRHQR